MTGEVFVGRYPFVFVVILVMIGIYGMAFKRNLLKKVVGMAIFQAAIYLLFIQGATKQGATIPVRTAELGESPELYINPLPQVIVLTALVVGVATTAVALSLLLVTYRRFGTLDEARILRMMKESP